VFFLFLILSMTPPLWARPGDINTITNMINARPPYPDPLVQSAGGFSDPFNLTPYPSKMLYASASAIKALEAGQGSQQVTPVSRLPKYKERMIGQPPKGSCSVTVLLS
jgi:hypothetical protein